MSEESPTTRKLLMASGASVSAAYPIGGHIDPMVPTAIIFPATLTGMTRIKMQVSPNEAFIDAGSVVWRDVYHNNSLLYLTPTASALMLIPDKWEQACYGMKQIRFVALDSSNVAHTVSQDTTLVVVLTPVDIDNPTVDDPNASGIAATAVTIIDGGDVAEGSKADAAVTNPASSGSVIALLKGILTDLGGVAGITVIPATIGGANPLIRRADTTAYAAGDVVSDKNSGDTGAHFWLVTGAARVSGGTGEVVGCIVVSDKVATWTPRLRIQLFNADPTSNLNDNDGSSAPFFADIAAYQGFIDLPAMQVNAVTTSSSSFAVNYDVRKFFKCNADANLRFILETLDAPTPASGQKIAIYLVIAQN